MKSVCAEALGVSRKNIYRQLKQPARDLALKEQIEAVHREHPAYGHRRVAIHLEFNHKRAQRVMAKFKLRPPRRRVKRYSTVSTSYHTYKNLLKERTVTHPHQVWCSDLTRIECRGTLWYIACIEDLLTSQIIAQRIGKRYNSHLVLAILHQAFATGFQLQNFHSNQGNEFMAQRCTDYLQQGGIQISVSDVASPWQNGYVESFFGRFKHELRDINRFDSPDEMIAAI